MDNIGFFTTCLEPEFPHPHIPERTLVFLCQVIEEAWHLLKQHPPDNFDIHTANEDTITELLVEILEDTLRATGKIPGFNAQFFGRVQREPKITNYNKKHPDKMPDIFFDLKREYLPIKSTQDGLFVECKPIDRRHPLRSCYCEKGVMRFVNGDYAWAMQEALMVGYIRNNKSYCDLKPNLNEAPYSTTAFEENTSNNSCCSTHQRHFTYFTKTKPPPITVHHLWLKTYERSACFSNYKPSKMLGLFFAE